ncbi:MAG: OmcA/MtrC family decaheme c-type cytochrome, partial [Candidatus Hydrogenedentes bacterium]|nr:OmcA/MtrC family decaheme c-type cytochrome [Candidatus Hydrogenedentota bacterium]
TGDTADNMTYYSNPLFTFRPDGQPVTATREIVKTEVCNGCHTTMAFHGGGRRETGLCILCHTTQSTDAGTGNILDLPQMIHKIHSGKTLPSVVGGTPYQIIGHGNTVNDYSDVGFPQDVRDCAVCHNGAAQSDVYLTKPTLEGCGSCHDRTWFGDATLTPAGYTNHPIAQEDNTMCAGCHPATGNNASIPSLNRVHVTPEQSSSAPGLNLAIVSVTPNPADGTLQTVVHVTNGAGQPITALSQLTRLAVTVAYPASDYQTEFSERMIASGTSTVPGVVDASDAANGNYGYTFKKTLPTGTSQTFALGVEGRSTFTIGTDPATHTQAPTENPIVFFTTDGSTPVPRRDVVDEANCLKCHFKLELHGGSRVSVPYCLFCHNSTLTAGTDDPPAESVHFDVLVHKIHRAENLTQPYVIGSLNANEVTFPGLVQECTICHLDGTVDLPLPAEATPTIITLTAGPPATTETVLPTRAACTACHDDPVVDTHATVMGDAATGAESCAVCHDATAPFSAAVSHALALP